MTLHPVVRLLPWGQGMDHRPEWSLKGTHSSPSWPDSIGMGLPGSHFLEMHLGLHLGQLL